MFLLLGRGCVGGEGVLSKDPRSGIFVYFFVADTIWHKQGFIHSTSFLSTYYVVGTNQFGSFDSIENLNYRINQCVCFPSVLAPTTFLPPYVKNSGSQSWWHLRSVRMGPGPALPTAGTSPGWPHGLPLEPLRQQVPRDALGCPPGLQSAFLLPRGAHWVWLPRTGQHLSQVLELRRPLLPPAMCLLICGPHSPHGAWFREAVWPQRAASASWGDRGSTRGEGSCGGWPQLWTSELPVKLSGETIASPTGGDSITWTVDPGA